VVGVTWFEAEAYTNWLSKESKRSVGLPTEEEWERAARGENGREYAWGNEFDRQNLNCAEFWGQKDDLSDSRKRSEWFESEFFQTASTTLIGQFAQGNTPENISDLSGNVWEWTNSWWEREWINRVLRGGSWFGVRIYARCADYDWNVLIDFSYDVGFRVVSPVKRPSGG